MEQEPASKITTAEWTLLLMAFIFFDIAEIILDLFVITAFIPTIIDLVLGPALVFYFYVRGVKLTWQRMLGLAAAWFGEDMPEINALPFWTLDIIYMWLSVRAEEGGLGAIAATVATASIERASGLGQGMLPGGPAAASPEAPTALGAKNPPKTPALGESAPPSALAPEYYGVVSEPQKTAGAAQPVGGEIRTPEKERAAAGRPPAQRSTAQGGGRARRSQPTAADDGGAAEIGPQNRRPYENARPISDVKTEAKPLSDLMTRKALAAQEMQLAFNRLKDMEKIVMQHPDRKPELETAKSRLREARRHVERLTL